MGTLYVIAYLARTQPYESKIANMQEIFNEFTVWIAAYPLFLFIRNKQIEIEPWVTEEQINNAGFVLVACIVLNLAFNTIVVLVMAIKTIYNSIRR